LLVYIKSKMSLETIIINGNTYTYYNPTDYQNFKLYQRQIKRVKEKIRATENGCYKDKVTKQGLPYYNDYEELLIFLETLLKEKQE
jgi:hypothetical protein